MREIFYHCLKEATKMLLEDEKKVRDVVDSLAEEFLLTARECEELKSELFWNFE